MARQTKKSAAEEEAAKQTQNIESNETVSVASEEQGSENTGSVTEEEAVSNVAEDTAEVAEEVVESTEDQKTVESTEDQKTEEHEEAVAEDSGSQEEHDAVQEPSQEEEQAYNFKDSELGEIDEQLKKSAESLEQIGTLDEAAAVKLKQELNQLEDIEKKIREDIEITENEIKKNNKRDALRSIFGRGFTEFWNGVSDGWNN